VSPRPQRVGPLTFGRLRAISFGHSCVYLALLICAFALGGPQPETFILGWTHGLLWIGMSLACMLAARRRLVSVRLAVAVAVLGGVGPFFGSYEFIREGRVRRAEAPPPAGSGGRGPRGAAGSPRRRAADGTPR
jgi:hypothetical protein